MRSFLFCLPVLLASLIIGNVCLGSNSLVFMSQAPILRPSPSRYLVCMKSEVDSDEFTVEGLGLLHGAEK